MKNITKIEEEEGSFSTEIFYGSQIKEYEKSKLSKGISRFDNFDIDFNFDKWEIGHMGIGSDSFEVTKDYFHLNDIRQNTYSRYELSEYNWIESSDFFVYYTDEDGDRIRFLGKFIRLTEEDQSSSWIRNSNNEIKHLNPDSIYFMFHSVVYDVKQNNERVNNKNWYRNNGKRLLVKSENIKCLRSLSRYFKKQTDLWNSETEELVRSERQRISHELRMSEQWSGKRGNNSTEENDTLLECLSDVIRHQDQKIKTYYELLSEYYMVDSFGTSFREVS